MKPDAAHALAVIDEVHDDLVRLRAAAEAIETAQDKAAVQFGFADTARKLADLHLDKLTADIDDPAWRDVEAALADLCADLGVSEDSAGAKSANEDRARAVANAMGYREHAPDLADTIVNGFEDGLRLTARLAWGATKLAVRGAVAAGKLAVAGLVVVGQAAGEAGDRIARRWLEDDHPRDENGKFTNKAAALLVLVKSEGAAPSELTITAARALAAQVREQVQLYIAEAEDEFNYSAWPDHTAAQLEEQLNYARNLEAELAPLAKVLAELVPQVQAAETAFADLAYETDDLKSDAENALETLANAIAIIEATEPAPDTDDA